MKVSAIFHKWKKNPSSIMLEDEIPKELNLSENHPKRAEFVKRIHSLYYGTRSPTKIIKRFAR